MFAKPDWFRAGRVRGTVRPRNLPGWMHTAVWSGVLFVPCLWLMDDGRLPETMIWLGAMSLAWWRDLEPVRTAQRAAKANELFVINDETDITRWPQQWLRGMLRR